MSEDPELDAILAARAAVAAVRNDSHQYNIDGAWKAFGDLTQEQKDFVNSPYRLEQARQDRQMAEMVAILESHGIRMSVGSCGCCSSPWIRFEYKGKSIVESIPNDDDDYDGAIRDAGFSMWETAV